MSDVDGDPGPARESAEVPEPDATSAAAQIRTSIEQQRASIGRFNLAIVGGTGVGKSSLVNAIFGESRAKVGIGLPVTSGVNYYASDTGTFGVWDFEGFEVGAAATPQEFVAKNLRAISEGPRIQHIAVVWYCIASTAARLTEGDIAAIRAFRDEGLHVILVLTKVGRTQNPLTKRWTYADDAVTFSEWLANPTDHAGQPIDLPVEEVRFTAAVDQGKFGGKPHGLDELLDATFKLSPDGATDALRVAQRLSLPMKRALARKYIAIATTAAGGAAVQPFPVADAALLAPIQLTMMGRIAVAYDLSLKGAMSADALATLALEFAGKAAARSLIKFIPGAGLIINTVVATTLTAASGEGWRRFCEAVYTGAVDLSRVQDAWRDYGPTALEVVNTFLKVKAKRTELPG